MIKQIIVLILIVALSYQIKAQTKGKDEITIGISGYPQGNYHIYKGETKYLGDFLVHGFTDKNSDGIAQAFVSIRKDDADNLDWISFDPDYNVTYLVVPPQIIDSVKKINSSRYYFSFFANADQLRVGEEYGFGVGACDELPPGQFGAVACVATAVGSVTLIVDPYPIQLNSCMMVNGSTSKIYLEWLPPENMNWNIDHYKIFMNPKEQTEYATLPEAKIVRTNILPDQTSIYIQDASRSVNPYYTVVGYDSLGEAIAISESLIPEFNINTFSLVFPSDGKVLNTLQPVFDWDDYGIGIYDLIYDTDSTFGNATVITDINQSEYELTTSLSDHTEYFWKIRTSDGIESNETGWSFSTNHNDEIPSNFSLTSPLNGTTVDDYLKSFSWTKSEDPGDSLFYIVNISETNDFSSLILIDTTVNNYYHTLFDFSEETTYYWKVIVKDTEDNTIESSDQFEFNFDINERPTDFRLLTPNFTLPVVSNLTPTLNWENSIDPENEGIINYTLCYSLDRKFNQKTVVENIITNSYTFTTNLEEDAQYYWKVIAEDQSGLVKWSNGMAYSFVTNNADRDPAQALLLNPIENLPYADDNVTFKWNRPEDDIYDIHEYKVIFSTDPEFNINNTEITLLMDTVYQAPPLEHGTYYWKVITDTHIIPIEEDGRGVLVQGGSSESTVSSFIVSPIYITGLVSPNGGEQWPVGTVQTISWISEGIEELKIEYSTDGGTSWNMIVEINDPNITNYSWEIPNDISENCYVRISDISGFAGSDMNDNKFIIEPYSVIYVSPFGSDLNGNGSKESPYSTIQTALENITGREDSIKVAGGSTYARFIIPTGGAKPIKIVGSYSVDFSQRDLSHKSIIDCDGGNGIENLPSKRVIDGFRFINFNNAIWHTSATSPWEFYFNNCEFIDGNKIGWISSAGSVNFVNCLFKDIIVGGIEFRQPKDINLINSVFVNVASSAFYPFGSVGTLKVENTNFINCGTGLQITDWYKKSYYISNSIFSGCNSGFTFGTSASGGYEVLDIRNNNFYDNTSNSNILLDESNIYFAPNFLDSINNDYRLKSHSQLIGKGDINSSPEYDFEYNLRPSPEGTQPDIGAFEHPTGEPFTGIYLSTKLFLEGGFTETNMNNNLTVNKLLPLNSNLAYAEEDFGYSSETVDEIPSDEIVDWVLIELRTDPNQPTNHKTPAFVLKNGWVVNLHNYGPVEFQGITSGEYYIVIYHRNHIPIMSANAILLSLNSPSYDFTSSQSKAYGSSPMKEIATGVFGMIAGDANGNGSVDYTDDVLNLWLPNFGKAEYSGADMNMDGIIDYSEDVMLQWLPNFGITTQVTNSSESMIDWDAESERVEKYFIRIKKDQKKEF